MTVDIGRVVRDVTRASAAVRARVATGRGGEVVTRAAAHLRQPGRRNRALALVASLALLLLVPADLSRTAATFVPLRQPFRGAELFVDPDTAAARWQAAHGARWLDPITRHPQARWVNGPTDIAPAAAAVRRAHQQGRLPVLVVYHVPNRDCAGPGAGAASAADYDRFIGELIAALGPQPAAIVVEPDAVAADCFTSDRARLLTRTVQRLAHAGHHVYLDAGHPNWRPVGEMVDRLLTAGIAGAEGFSVNVANRQTTQDSYEWARTLSDQLGGREFVIDTSRNGVGPPPGHEWCNPRHEALGEPPTTDVDRPGLAALLWIKPPGESDGTCGGKNGHFFSPDLARRLVRNGSGD
ncbi:MAG: glycoside hydrolase family 6 protein [Micromonosporaceae bacterium]